MKRILYIPFLAALTLFAVACESEIRPDEEFDGEAAVSFMPMLGGINTDVMPDSDPASRTKASDIVSADGSISLALGYEVCADSASPQTKGTQLNTTGYDGDLGDYSISSFKVAAWKGSSALIPANTEVTRGTSVWTTSTPYLWGASQEATFYAYANLPSSGATVIFTSSASQMLAYTALPTAATAQNDILLGFYKGKGRYDATLHKGGIADIKFYHPMTAVQFKLKPGAIDGATTVSVKKISISKVHPGGTAVMTPPATGSTVPVITWTPLTSAGTTTVTLGDGTSDLTVDSSKDYLIGEPFLLIPQVLTSYPVSVTVELSIDGTPTTLAAKINTGEWKAGKTNIYTLGYDSKSFTLTGPNDYEFFGTTADSDDTQTIDCYVKDGTAGTLTAGDYYLEYSTDGGESYSSTSPDWVSVTVGNGTNGKDRQMTVSVTEITDFTTVSTSQALQMMPEKTDFDLSKFNPATGKACATSTANTYVINSAGTYKFPVVYGNALKNGSYNTQAYKPGTGSNPSMNPSGQNGYYYSLNSFLDYQDQPVSSPYILENKTGTYTAGVLWSDVNNLVTDVALNGNGKDAFISFTVDKNYINEGNAVIYLADSSGTIVWSWQIWVNAYDISQTVSLRNNSGQTHNLMAINLGWEAISSATMDMPSPRSVKIRIVMSYNGEVKKEKEFYVNQSAPGKYTQATDGRNTFYQWGRKDPIVPGGCRNVYNVKSGASPVESITYQSKTFVSARAQYASSSSEAGVTIGQTIKAPYIHYCSYWQAPTKYDIVNLWNGAATDRNYTGETQKTIYDPSPVGFAVPSANVFTGLIYSGTEATTRDAINAVGDFDPTSATGTGWTFYTGGWYTGTTLSFALSGNRDSHQSHWANRLDADVVSDTPQDEGRLWTSASTRVSGNSNVLATGLVYHPTWVKPKHTFDEADATSIRAVKEAE